MSLQRDDLSRPVLIHLCKDGTISYRHGHQRVFNGRALPVFSVQTEQEARALQTRFGRVQYGEHPLIPGETWYVWTDFSGELEDLGAVSDACRAWYESVGRRS